jgi:hypothetical protein
MAMVTRLGEFSPMEQKFILGEFLKITDVGNIFGRIFSAIKVMY